MKDKVWKLAEALVSLDGVRRNIWTAEKGVADLIIANPQATVDALVEAGVLREWGTMPSHPDERHYLIVPAAPPHEHQWRVYPDPDDELATGNVLIGCSCGSCDEYRIVPNRLPIEVPE